MAQDGDTITYTYDGNTGSNDTYLIPQNEDISNINSITVDYLYSAGGESTDISSGGSGGAVEDAEIDVSDQDNLYIFVSGGQEDGRYSSSEDPDGGGSTEISFSDTNANDSDDEPFLVAAGGGSSGGFDSALFGTLYSDGARSDPVNGAGITPPQGGTENGDGDGAIDDQNRGLVKSGTTIKGGGSTPDVDGEVQISYSDDPLFPPPDSPSNLTAEVQ